ncbi:hypothetical protein ACRRS0_08565 [Agarivorans sp. QJM3NY_29]|uniref:hypothetical protein n=1 Tax=unclassified Agarivorans TaxID=2636026 RepID=UPI003D7E26C1
MKRSDLSKSNKPNKQKRPKTQVRLVSGSMQTNANQQLEGDFIAAFEYALELLEKPKNN